MTAYRLYACLPPALLSAVLCLGSVAALASDGHGEHAAHGESSQGLPQFDPSSFPSQILWIAITFAVMYIFFSKKTLPEISGVIENRKQQIQGDMETAEKLTKEADAVQEAYEEALAQARTDAAQVLQTLNEEIKAEAAKEQETFRKRYEKDVKATETKVEKATQNAMAEMDDIAVDLCSSALEKVTGIKADAKTVKDVINSLNDTRKAA